ncbi:MAG: TetR/AcrR family transcriptional regulator [Anaerohalosphaera sp.]|nr:TetR/AcrR family transcriptional regulator [Anaerohalosphaera sp.]
MPRTAPHMPLKLAEAAFEQFATEGFANVNLDQIAVHAGVTKGAIYCHYKSKHELILAACMHYYRLYQVKVHGLIASVPDPLDRLRKVLELSIYNCVIDKKNRVFTTEIFALSLQHIDVRSGWAQFYDTVRELFIGLVTTAKLAGQLQIEDPRSAVDMMLSAIEGIKLRATFEPHISDPVEQQNLVQGLLKILGYTEGSSADVMQKS